jgi:hypothetical protein
VALARVVTGALAGLERPGQILCLLDLGLPGSALFRVLLIWGNVSAR